MRARRLSSARPWSFRKASVPRMLYLLAAVCALLLLFRTLGNSWELRGLLVHNLYNDQYALQRLTQENYWSNMGFHGPKRRGIVICAGGNTLLANVYVSVKVLRGTLNSTLPIEIYHQGPRELDSKLRAAFAEFSDLEFIDLTTLPFPDHQAQPALFNGYVQKVFSLYSTEFEQVLLLDADSQPLIDPSVLFNSLSFTKTGNLFWPDFWAENLRESPKECVYQWLGIPPPWTYLKGWRCAESGQVLFDRQRHRDVLEWLWFLNAHAQLLYQHMLGDKDTFEMAFILAGKEALYNRAPFGPGMPLSTLQHGVHHDAFFHRSFRSKMEHDRYLRLGMLQFDESASPAFLHRTERTKFAKSNGYSLEVMQPAFFIPPLTTDMNAKIRYMTWSLHSVPISMADINCSCCSLDWQARAVVEQTTAVEASGFRADLECKSHVNGLPRLPLYPISALGERFRKVVDAGFVAYESFLFLMRRT